MAVSVTSGTLLVINVNFFFAIKSTDPALYYTLTYFSVLHNSYQILFNSFEKKIVRLY